MLVCSDQYVADCNMTPGLWNYACHDYNMSGAKLPQVCWVECNTVTYTYSINQYSVCYIYIIYRDKNSDRRGIESLWGEVKVQVNILCVNFRVAIIDTALFITKRTAVFVSYFVKWRQLYALRKKKKSNLNPKEYICPSRNTLKWFLFSFNCS